MVYQNLWMNAPPLNYADTCISRTEFDDIAYEESCSNNTCSPEGTLHGDDKYSFKLGEKHDAYLLLGSPLDDWQDNPVLNTRSLDQQYGSTIGLNHDNKPPSSSSESAVSSTLLQKIARKRPACEDHIDWERRHTPSLRQPSCNTFDPGSPSLACPFYKRDSSKYLSCRSNVLRRIKDVKQHIVRKHKKPEFYCPVCFDIFEETTTRDDHIQLRACFGRPDPMYDGITDDQKKHLSQPSRGSTIMDQWRDTWRVLFPDVEPPNSPYIRNY